MSRRHRRGHRGRGAGRSSMVTNYPQQLAATARVPRNTDDSFVSTPLGRLGQLRLRASRPRRRAALRRQPREACGARRAGTTRQDGRSAAAARAVATKAMPSAPACDQAAGASQDRLTSTRSPDSPPILACEPDLAAASIPTSFCPTNQTSDQISFQLRSIASDASASRHAITSSTFTYSSTL